MLRTRLSLGSLALVPLLLLAWGCADKDGNAQTTSDSGSVVPSDIQVIMQRADRARIEGDSTAPVRMVEISDFQCPFCKQYYDQTYARIDSAYIETGKVQYLWISFPNPNHVHSWPAIEASFCAGAVGKFWPMHDLLFQHQEEWANSDTPMTFFEKYAHQLGIDAESYGTCLEEDRPAPLQVRDLTSVTRVGVNGTPFFIIGDSISLEGAAPFDKFKEVIDSLVAVRSKASSKSNSDGSDGGGKPAKKEPAGRSSGGSGTGG